jgi:hypothetical protein
VRAGPATVRAGAPLGLPAAARRIPGLLSALLSSSLMHRSCPRPSAAEHSRRPHGGCGPQMRCASRFSTVAVHARTHPPPLRARPRLRARLQVSCDVVRRLAACAVAAWRMRCPGRCTHISRHHATRLQRTPRRRGRSQAVLPACRCRPLGFGVPHERGCARQQPATPPACVSTPQARSRGERRGQRVTLSCGPPCAGAGCRR